MSKSQATIQRVARGATIRPGYIGTSGAVREMALKVFHSWLVAVIQQHPCRIFAVPASLVRWRRNVTH